MKLWEIYAWEAAALGILILAGARWRYLRRRDRAWAAQAAERVKAAEYLAHLEKELAGTGLHELAALLRVNQSAEDPT